MCKQRTKSESTEGYETGIALLHWPSGLTQHYVCETQNGTWKIGVTHPPSDTQYAVLILTWRSWVYHRRGGIWKPRIGNTASHHEEVTRRKRVLSLSHSSSSVTADVYFYAFISSIPWMEMGKHFFSLPPPTNDWLMTFHRDFIYHWVVSEEFSAFWASRGWDGYGSHALWHGPLFIPISSCHLVSYYIGGTRVESNELWRRGPRNFIESSPLTNGRSEENQKTSGLIKKRRKKGPPRICIYGLWRDSCATIKDIKYPIHDVIDLSRSVDIGIGSSRWESAARMLLCHPETVRCLWRNRQMRKWLVYLVYWYIYGTIRMMHSF